MEEVALPCKVWSWDRRTKVSAVKTLHPAQGKADTSRRKGARRGELESKGW
jgi:hypothetical protein